MTFLRSQDGWIVVNRVNFFLPAGLNEDGERLAAVSDKNHAALQCHEQQPFLTGPKLVC